MFVKYSASRCLDSSYRMISPRNEELLTTAIGRPMPRIASSVSWTPGIGRVDHEAEVGVVIGRRATKVSERDAHQYVFGLICFNDVSARGLQQKGYQYTHAKGFDTFAPLGPCIAAGVDHRGSAGIGIEGWVNGQRRQASTTAQLVFSIDYLIAYVTNVMTLLPGDVVATGTPSGVGPLQPGDEVTIKVAGVGELTNPVGGTS